MQNYLGDIIYAQRQKFDETQDQYGQRYNVSGPAIFKFEKGYVKPSLELWLKMAKDADVTERRAVLLWLKAKLPEQYQEYVEIPTIDQVAPISAGRSKKSVPAGKTDYSKFDDREQIRTAMAEDTTLPNRLRELINDDELWALYKPTGSEINMLRDTFGAMGKATTVHFREALRLIRDITNSH